MHNRLGAALVGWSASWWMGLVVGVPLLSVGLILPGWRVYLTRGLAAFAIITATALLFGIGGLVYATWTASEHNLPAYWYPDAEIDRVAFARAGTMHNFSYLGGFLGLLVGVSFLAVERYRIAKRPK